MSLRLRTLNETPPGRAERGFWCADTKTRIAGHYAYADLRDAVIAHYKANNIPTPLNLDELIQDQECQHLPGNWCVDANGRSWPNAGWSGALNLGAVKQGTMTLLGWFAGGAQKVSREEVETRSAICATCQFNQLPGECQSCGASALYDIINRIVGGESYPSDNQLNACTVCLCSLKAKVRLPLDLLQKHMSDEQKTRLPAHCWLKE